MAGPSWVVPGATVVRPDDRGLLYGEGVFETLHLRPAGPWLLDAHLDRMASSAAVLDLALPPRESIVALADEAAAAWSGPEGALRLICTAGPASLPPPAGPPPPAAGPPPPAAGPPPPAAGPSPPAAGPSPPAAGPSPPGPVPEAGPLCFATVSAVPETVLRQRREGIRLITAGTGVRAGHRPPWSLSGAKTLSYAENIAARRWATRQGADDVLWLSSDGYALEAPTASLVWLAGDTLCTVPAAETGILPGTTAAHLLSRATGLGLSVEHRMITRDELAGAGAIWLASALRGLAEVVTLDGAPRPRSPWTARLLNLLGYPPRPRPRPG